jgi:hypothetical protein
MNLLIGRTEIARASARELFVLEKLYPELKWACCERMAELTPKEDGINGIFRG